jgi:hypothetical protein
LIVKSEAQARDFPKNRRSDIQQKPNLNVRH